MSILKYIIDTSSLIQLNKHNPMDIYPGVWKKVEGLVRKNRLLAPKEVYYEISRKDDILFEWSKNQKDMFIEPTNQQIEIVKEILNKYPAIIRLDRKYDADSWVIAIAIEKMRSKQSTLTEIKRVVVTEEKIRGNRIRIPYICEHFNVESIDILEMFRMEGWRF